MKHTPIICAWLVISYTVPAKSQEAVPKKEGVPLYNVTVIERTTQAINYQYRSGPTRIDFRGTVLLPYAKGDATVESHRGRVEIQADFKNLTPPTRYGREYLTYTLWAITPEGAAHNLGEVVPDGSNKARLRVTTGMQAFGLIVTAEPYAAARQPSDVVVLENEVRPDTVGKIQPIQAKYDLMPRGHYTWEVPDKLESSVAGMPKVSMAKYEALLELYEAQNALGIAQAAGAGHYAPNTFQKAQSLVGEAQRLQAGKAPTSMVVQNAREAAQTAEDARVIAERRRQEEKLTMLRDQAVKAQQAQSQAQAEAQRARAEADAARAQAEAERAARQRAEAEAAQARRNAAQAQAASAPPAAPPPPQMQPDPGKTGLRMRLLEQLNGVLATRDTPRGLVVTVADAGFRGSELRESASSQVARVGAILERHPGLRVDVEGYTDSASTGAVSWRRAEDVRHMLLGQGLPGASVSARGLGDARLLVSNSSSAGRAQNRRVEIVITGGPIGDMPFWDRAYNLVPAPHPAQPE